MSVVDEVKQKLDIVEVIGEHTKLTKSGRNYRGLCPFHSEKNPSFYVYPERQSWHCFGACATGGDVFAFVMKQQGIDFGEALRLLAQRAGVIIPERAERQEERDERNRLYEANAAAARYFHDQLLNAAAGQPARDYLSKRGITPETITGFQLGYSPNSRDALKKHLAANSYTEAEMVTAGLLYADEKGPAHDRFRNKLMFPIFDARGRVTGFGARVLDNSLPKYVNSPQTPVFDKSGSLYAVNLAATPIRRQDLAVIVEGYMDVLTAHQHGFNNVVASMGIAITEKQVNALKKLTKNLVLALDADTAGEEAMLRCVDYENTLKAEIRVNLLPEGKDPDDLIREDPEAWTKRLEQAVPIVDYTFDMLLKGLDLSAARDKSLATERLRPAIDSIKDPVRRAHYLQKLAGLLRVEERTLEAALRQNRAGTGRKTRASEATTPALRPFSASPLEADCLTLLLQHPELREETPELLPDYFENTENRAIFLAWRETGELSLITESLDPALHEYLDTLAGKELPPAPVAQRYAEYARRLRERYLRNLEAKKAEVFAGAVASEGSGADLARLEEAGIENAVQLKEIYAQKSHQRPELRR